MVQKSAVLYEGNTGGTVQWGRTRPGFIGCAEVVCTAGDGYVCGKILNPTPCYLSLIRVSNIMIMKYNINSKSITKYVSHL